MPENITNFADDWKVSFSDFDGLGGICDHLEGSSKPYQERELKSRITFHPNLWKDREIWIWFTIAHEMAHAALKAGKIPGKKDGEVQADRLAVEWLSEYFEREVLEREAHYLEFHREKLVWKLIDVDGSLHGMIRKNQDKRFLENLRQRTFFHDEKYEEWAKRQLYLWRLSLSRESRKYGNYP